MKRSPHLPVLFLAACALWASPLHAASGHDAVRTKARLNLSFTLTPTEAATDVTGQAKLKVRTKRGVSVARLHLETSGLPSGTYQVDALNRDATTVHLGEFVIEEEIVDDADEPEVEGAEDPAAGGEDGVAAGDDQADGDEDSDSGEDDPALEHEKIESDIKLAPEVNVLAIESIAISEVTGSVVLEGGVSATEGTSQFFANVDVVAPVAAVVEDASPSKGHKGSKGRKVHGHVTLVSRSEDGVETERHVIWVAFNAPASAPLTILVDGVVAGTVTSTARGKVKFSSLAEEVLLPTIKKIEVVDDANAVVMEATVAK